MPQHADPDVLALLALGEPVGSTDDTAHVAACAHCQSELDQLRAVVSTSRAVEPADRPAAPPAQVWDRIADELGLGAASAAVRLPTADLPRRGPSWRGLAIASVAAALIGALATLGIVTAVSDRGGPSSVVARASLAALPDHSGSGKATVVGAGAGRTLDVDVSGLGPVDGYYEVWLLDADGKKLVSLGLLRGTHARFALPPGVDIATYPVVDVSIEPADGNPAHSGNSVVRGRLAS